MNLSRYFLTEVVGLNVVDCYLESFAHILILLQNGVVKGLEEYSHHSRAHRAISADDMRCAFLLKSLADIKRVTCN